MTHELWPMFSDDEIDSIPPPNWLVDGHLTDGLTMIFGPPGSGKSLLALDWALCIASDRRWMGREVEPGPVVYVSGEGAGGIPQRRQAWKHDRHRADSQLYLIPFGVRLYNREHVVALRDDIHAVGAKLLVVDTLARSMAGADENSTEQMSMVIQGLDWIREKTGCGVLVVHHTDKAGVGPRGNSALFGAVDTSIRVTSEDKYVELACDKQKDGVPFDRWHLQLKEVAGSVVLSTSTRATFGVAL